MENILQTIRGRKRKMASTWAENFAEGDSKNLKNKVSDSIWRTSMLNKFFILFKIGIRGFLGSLITTLTSKILKKNVGSNTADGLLEIIFNFNINRY